MDVSQVNRCISDGMAFRKRARIEYEAIYMLFALRASIALSLL